MTAKEAWALVQQKIKDVKPQTACELEDSFIFSVQPVSSPFGVGTGMYPILVDKKTSKVEGVDLSDPRLSKGSMLKILDISQFKIVK